MEEHLISVIIPVYNVSEYLEECYRAIVSQTYKNLEIIFIDDGSTDNSGVLCDRFADEDSRIRVIHKENGGQSSARNAGLEIASGDIISFIDSDDCPRYNMLERLLYYMTKYQVEIACCDYSSVQYRQFLTGETKLLKSDQAIALLLDEDGYRCFPWNKLYRKELFDNLRFPEGEVFEDIKVTYMLFKKASQVCYLKDDLYFYRIREYSTTRSKFSVDNRDCINAINFVKTDADCWMARTAYKRFIVGYIFYYMGFVKKSVLADSELPSDISYLRNCIKNNVANIIKSGAVGGKIKLELLLFGVSPQGFKVLLKKREKK